MLARKRRLRAIMPRIESRLRCVDHVQARGQDLFRACVERDLEGIVAKWRRGTYRTDGGSSSWLKIKNANYSQIRNRHELFDRWRVEGARHRRSVPVPLLELR